MLGEPAHHVDRVPVLLTRAHRAERRTHQARAHRVAATARSQQALTPLAVPLLLKPRLQELTARLDGTEDAVAAALETLTAAVADLKAQFTQLLKQEREKGIPPRRWAASATRKDWDTLVGWVDELNASYSLLGEYTVPPCWPAHPGVVEDLAGVHHAWKIAVINDELAKNNGANDLTAWHDRWLWPCLRRMKSGHYRTTNCRDRHQPERPPAQPTDLLLIPRAACVGG